MCPPFDAFFNISYMVKYSDNVFSSLKYIFSELEKVAKNYNEQYLLPRVIELKNKIMKDFFAFKLSVVKFRKFYKNYISDMSEELVNLVKKNVLVIQLMIFLISQ